MAELSEFSQSYADSLYKVSGMQCVIFDSDKVIACTGSAKKDAIGMPAAREIEDILSQRTSYFRQYQSEKPISPYPHSDGCIIGAAPIIASGDGVGVVALIGGENDVLTDGQKKLLVLTSTLLANHLEI